MKHTTSRRFESVAEYLKATGQKQWFVAQRWGVSKFQMSALVHRGRYPVVLTPDQATAIARDLNQPVSYVSHMYEVAA